MQAYENIDGVRVEAQAIAGVSPASGPVDSVQLDAPSEDKPSVFVDPAFSESGRPKAGDMFLRYQGLGQTAWMTKADFDQRFKPA